MFDNQLFSWLHLLVGWLLQPVTWGLFGLLAFAIAMPVSQWVSGWVG